MTMRLGVRTCIQSLDEQLKSLWSGIKPAGLPLCWIHYCRDAAHGDLSSSVPFLLAKSAGMAPQLLAQEWAEKLEHEALASCHVAGGYLNIRLKESFKYRLLQELVQSGLKSLVHPVAQNQHYFLEFVSSNPTGPLHVGHGRQAVIGDVLANILRALGGQVSTEYYVNDAGMQMHVLLASVYWRAMHAEVPMTWIQGLYAGDYVTEMCDRLPKTLLASHEAFEQWLSALPEALQHAYHQGLENADLLKAWVLWVQERLGSSRDQVLESILEVMMGDIASSLAALGVHMQVYRSEREVVASGRVQKVLDVLHQAGYLYHQDGAQWFASGRLGDDKDRVLVRSNGEYTYFLNDLAYHMDKFERVGPASFLNLLGADHHGYVARLQHAMSVLLPKMALNVRLVQFVSLVQQGQRLAMSTRRACFERLWDVLNFCGPDATRFFYLQRQVDQPLEFDLDLAIAQSQENPVYYIQYAFARLCRLLDKAGDFDQTIGILGAEESALWMHLMRLEEVLMKCQSALDPHPLTQYVFELAKKFHAYYNQTPILTAPSPLREGRLLLLTALALVLEESLMLLGLSRPRSM